MAPLDDTQPIVPVKEKPPLNAGLPPEGEPSYNDGPGCMFWAFLSLIAVGMAILVVLMAGAAGYTAGQKVADTNATATQEQLIGQQLIRIPTDVLQANTVNLARRIEYLAEVAPGLPELPSYQETATAVYLTAQPTATTAPTETPVFTPTPEATEEPEVTSEVNALPTPSDSGFDLIALYGEAQTQIAAGQYQDAYETLDAISRIDPTFQTEAVRGTLHQTLLTLATRAYASTETLAEAIRWTDLAEGYGPIGDLEYERFIAGLFLDSQRAVGAGNNLAAIRSLQQIIGFQSTYKGVDLNRQLFNAYVAAGDAFRDYDRDFCRAQQNYNAALSLFGDQGVVAKRDAAQTACEQGATALPGEGTPGGEDVAPIGQPGS